MARCSVHVAGLVLAALALTSCVSGADVTSGDSRLGRADGDGILAEAAARTVSGAALLDPAEVRSGGVPVDGIPAVDDPVVVDAAEASRSLVESEPVLLVTVGSTSRAYPLRSLTRHEIVNDTLGGIPIAATWCPLCNTGLAFARELDGTLYDFGVSGLLHRSAMIM